MSFNQGKCRQAILLLTGLSSSIVFSASQPASQPANYNHFLKSPSKYLSKSLDLLKHGHAIIQLGGYWSIQGENQHINIDGLIGDQFTLTNGNASNGLAGVGYFIDGQDTRRFTMSYGLNFFYLAKTAVTGDVIQENLFTNLAYRYNATHYPLYAVAKSTIKTPFPKNDLTLDVGIGPNFMWVSGFKEQSLDGITIPDNIFSSHTSTTFSATVGVGLKVNQFFGQAPLECGYRFFYLGQGHLNATTNQVQHNLNTGSDFANAVMCSITV